MEALSPPRGLIVELVTPFRKGGGIDGAGLERLLARVSPHAQGVFLAGPRGGEEICLSLELRMELLHQAIFSMRHAPLPIFIWVTQQTEEGTRETFLALSDAMRKEPRTPGLFFVDTPLYYHSNRGLSEFYREICPIIAAPLILHNDPDLIQGLARPLKRNNIRTAILKELIEINGIAGMIFSGSLDRAHHYQRACRQRPGFRIYDGDEIHFLDHPSRSGVVSLGANLAPAAWGKIVQSSLEPSPDGADYPDRLQQIWETGDTLHRMRDLYGGSPAPIIKDVLAEMGIIDPPAQPPEAFGEVEATLRKWVDKLED